MSEGIRLSDKSIALLGKLKDLNGQGEEIASLLQDQQSGRRRAYDLLSNVADDLNQLQPRLTQYIGSIGSSVLQMSNAIDGLLENANGEQIKQLEALKAVAGKLEPNQSRVQEIEESLNRAVAGLSNLLEINPANLPPPPPPQGGRRRRKYKGGYTYKKTKNYSSGFRTPRSLKTRTSRRTKTRRTRRV